jgi:hypothetical protein
VKFFGIIYALVLFDKHELFYAQKFDRNFRETRDVPTVMRMFAFLVALALGNCAFASEQEDIHEVRVDNVMVVVQEGTLYFCNATVAAEVQCTATWTPESYIAEQFGAGAIVRGVLPSLGADVRPGDGIVIYFQEGKTNGGCQKLFFVLTRL